MGSLARRGRLLTTDQGPAPRCAARAHTAVELARMELNGGANTPAKELARRTDEDVRTQIQQLLRMVAG